jgi:hypothetical protein
MHMRAYENVSCLGNTVAAKLLLDSYCASIDGLTAEGLKREARLHGVIIDLMNEQDDQDGKFALLARTAQAQMVTMDGLAVRGFNVASMISTVTLTKSGR